MMSEPMDYTRQQYEAVRADRDRLASRVREAERLLKQSMCRDGSLRAQLDYTRDASAWLEGGTA